MSQAPEAAKNRDQNRRAATRRTFLRGAGVTIALPWLESVTAFGAVLADKAATPPKRFAALFMGCGINPDHWSAKGAGASMELGRCLEPLAPLRSKLNVINGLFNKHALGVGIHPGQTGNILSGAALKKGAELKGGISVDQVLAKHLGEQTDQPSMVLGCEQPITGYHETNFSMAYSSHISWQSATSPVPMEVYPSLAFDALFDNRGSKRNQSILDRVRDEAMGLSRKVSAGDRAKLDEYLTSVREVERRVVPMRKEKAAGDARAADKNRPALTMTRPDNGLPEDVREHMRLMCDLIALGFQSDRTRIATLLLCRDISGLFYPFLEVRPAHHTASHDDRSENYLRVTQFYVSQLAYLASKLDAMPEAEGAVLDNTCLLFTNSLWSGTKHDATKVPLVLAGGLGGTLETGRVLDYRDAGDEHRRLCSLYLGIMDRMGVKLDRFGDADSRLAGF
jgi:hypothetical protein